MGVRLVIVLLITGMTSCRQEQEIVYYDLNEKMVQRIL